MHLIQNFPMQEIFVFGSSNIFRYSVDAQFISSICMHACNGIFGQVVEQEALDNNSDNIEQIDLSNNHLTTAR